MGESSRKHTEHSPLEAAAAPHGASEHRLRRRRTCTPSSMAQPSHVATGSGLTFLGPLFFLCRRRVVELCIHARPAGKVTGLIHRKHVAVSFSWCLGSHQLSSLSSSSPSSIVIVAVSFCVVYTVGPETAWTRLSCRARGLLWVIDWRPQGWSSCLMSDPLPCGFYHFQIGCWEASLTSA